MKTFLTVAAITVASIVSINSRLLAWNIFDIGYGGNVMYGVAVGNGRNDGVTRIYGANANSQIYEFTFSGGSWNSTSIGTGTGNMMSLAIGDARNDGVQRVYGANATTTNSPTGHLFEFEYKNNAWIKVDISSQNSVGGSINAIAIGSGRTDGKNRIYCACSDNHVYEFEYTSPGVDWTKTDMGSGGGSMTGIALGAGQNDSKTRIYGSNADDFIYEFTYASGWSYNNFVGSGGAAMAGVAVGNGRNDGTLRVFGANVDGHVYEYSFANSTWTTVDMGSAGSMQSVIVANAKNDGIARIYAASQDTHLYEFAYQASAWSAGDIGVANSSAFLQSISSGTGRNDGVIRIYGADRDDHIYEFSYTTSTLIIDNQSNNMLSNAIIYPTFANLSKGDKINFANFTPSAKLIILSPAGHVIKTLQADGSGIIDPWDGTINNGGKAASGTYIVHAADSKGQKKIFKILLVK